MTQNIVPALKKYFEEKQGVVGVIVFGSFANGDNTRRSDLDLVIIRNTKERFIDRLKNYLDIDDVTGISTDLLVYTPEEWEDMKKTKFFSNTPQLVII